MDTKAKSQSNVARKERAYKVEETSITSSSTLKSPIIVLFNDQVLYKIAYLLKDVISKNPSYEYIDSCSSSHITNKDHCFRGPLVQIRRRYIQVRGGLLHLDSIGTAILKDQKGKELELHQTLFVLNLRANLLLIKTLYRQL